MRMADDFDRDEAERNEKPWRADPRYGGMSDESARLSWEATQKTKSAESNGAGNGFDDQDREEDCRPPEYSDDALALVFAEKNAARRRYVAGWGKWLYWNDGVWQDDPTLDTFDQVRKSNRELAGACKEPKVSKSITSAYAVAATERLARSDRRLAATTEQWDADPLILNTPHGPIDLRTGELRPADPTNYLTKCTAIAPSGVCPLWLQFLKVITNGEDALQKYLQRLLGYCLTGLTIEHAMAFFYGTGSNGKSVLLSTVSGILKDYHRTAPIETFTASKNERHPTELAGLRGARMVTSIETEEGRRWAESKIKALTGGDTISARFMRQDFFDYTPQFKLVIAGNHKPSLRTVDEAMRRRFNLVPFTVTIPPEKRDKQLPIKLQGEWPGILSWMIQGCLEWQRIGLSPPETVARATAEYLTSEDAIAAWLDDCASLSPNAFSTSADLFKSWKDWAEKTGEWVGSAKNFGSKLRDRNFESTKTGGVRGFKGIRLPSIYGVEQ
jgi:putative DNA primase/helicase